MAAEQTRVDIDVKTQCCSNVASMLSKVLPSESFHMLAAADQKLPASANGKPLETIGRRSKPLVDVLTTFLNGSIAGPALRILTWSWAFQLIVLVVPLLFVAKPWRVKQNEAWSIWDRLLGRHLRAPVETPKQEED